MSTFFSVKRKFSAHYEALFHNATICIIVTNEENRIVAANPFSANLFGYTVEELIGQPVEILIPHRYRDKHRNYHKEYFKIPVTQAMDFEKEIDAVKKDGTEIPMEIRLNHYRYNNEDFVIAFLTDISERKSATAKYHELNKKLESTVRQRTIELTETFENLKISKQKLEAAYSFQKSILEKAGAIIVSTDVNGLIKTFNRAAEVSLGYTANEMIGKHTPAYFHCPVETKQKAEQISKELGEPVEPGFNTYVIKAKKGLPHEDEWVFIRKDGSRFPVSLIVTALRNEENELTGYIGVGVDISEHKKEEERLRQLLIKEKELSELKSRFVSMASHEFRTPLSTILSSAYLIEQYGTTENQPKRQKHLQRVISSVNMLTDTLNDFLNVGKIEEGKIRPKISSFDIMHLIKTSIEEIRQTIKKGQTIHYEHEGEGLIDLDPSLMKHIVINLISNASKFSPEYSNVTIHTVRDKESLRLSVKDNGIGISKEDQEHLMERFFRGSNAVNIQGTGLGLHIVAKYAELMSGKIEWISELEKGTEFIVTFNLNDQL